MSKGTDLAICEKQNITILQSERMSTLEISKNLAKIIER